MPRHMTRIDRNRIIQHNRTGPGTCLSCSAPIHRYETAARNGLREWSPDPEGRFWLHPVTAVMHIYDETMQGDFWRFRPHSCVLACTPDESDQ